MSAHEKPPLILRVFGAIFTLLMLLSFGIPLIGAGHGIGPIRLLLVLGSMDAWGLEITLSWLGIAASLVSLFGGDLAVQLGLRTLGLALLVSAFVLFLQMSEARDMTLLTGGPFILCALIQLILLIADVCGRSGSSRHHRP